VLRGPMTLDNRCGRGRIVKKSTYLRGWPAWRMRGLAWGISPGFHCTRGPNHTVCMAGTAGACTRLMMGSVIARRRYAQAKWSTTNGKGVSRIVSSGCNFGLNRHVSSMYS
jgi:hypothetical protein